MGTTQASTPCVPRSLTDEFASTSLPAMELVGRVQELREIEAGLLELGVVTVTGLPGIGKTRVLNELLWRRGVPGPSGPAPMPPPPGQDLSPAAPVLLQDDEGLSPGTSLEERVQQIRAQGHGVLIESQRSFPLTQVPSVRVVMQPMTQPDEAEMKSRIRRALGVRAATATTGPATGAEVLQLGGNPKAILISESLAARGQQASERDILEEVLSPSLTQGLRELLAPLSLLEVPLRRQDVLAIDKGWLGLIDTALDLHLLESRPAGLIVAAPVRVALSGRRLHRANLLSLAGIVEELAWTTENPARVLDAVTLLLHLRRPASAERLLERFGAEMIHLGMGAAVAGKAAALEKLGRQQSRPLSVLVSLAQSDAGGSVPGDLEGSAGMDCQGLPVHLETAVACLEATGGNRGRAFKRLQELAGGPGTRRMALKLRADLHFRNREFEQARQDYRTCGEGVEGAGPRDGSDSHRAFGDASLAGLGNVAFQEGRLTEADGWIRRRMQRLEAASTPHSEATMLVNRGMLACARGELPEASSLCRSAAEIRRSRGELNRAALALANFIQVEALRGNLAKVEEGYQELLTMTDSDELLASASKGLALAKLQSRSSLEAMNLAMRGASLAEAASDDLESLECRIVAGLAALQLGDTGRAAELADRCLSQARRLNAQIALCDAELLRGRIELARERPGEAEKSVSAASRLAEFMGYRLGSGEAKLLNGLIHASLGQLDQAVECLRWARRIGRSSGARPLELEAQEALAALALSRGDWESLLGLCNQVEDRTGRFDGMAIRALVGRGEMPAARERLDRMGGSGALLSAEKELARTWIAIREGCQDEAATALDRVDPAALAGDGESELVLLHACVAEIQQRSDEAVRRLEVLLKGESTGVAWVAGLGLLQRLAEQSGRRDLLIGVRHALEGQRENGRGWLTALGMDEGRRVSPYLMLTCEGPSVVREEAAGPRFLESQDLGVDMEADRLFVSGVGWIPFSGKRKPLELLAALIHGRNNWMSKQQIHEAVWGSTYDAAIHPMNVYALVSRLRRELERAGSERKWILTNRSSGDYRLAAGVRGGVWIRPSVSAA